MIFSSEKQLSKAPASIYVMLSGITTVLSDIHLENAPFLINVTGRSSIVSGIVTILSLPMNSSIYIVSSCFE